MIAVVAENDAIVAVLERQPVRHVDVGLEYARDALYRMRLKARVAGILGQARDRLENRGLEGARLFLETLLELLVDLPVDGSVLAVGGQQPAYDLTGRPKPLDATGGTLPRRLKLPFLPDPLPVVDLRGGNHEGHKMSVALRSVQRRRQETESVRVASCHVRTELECVGGHDSIAFRASLHFC